MPCKNCKSDNTILCIHCTEEFCDDHFVDHLLEQERSIEQSMRLAYKKYGNNIRYGDKDGFCLRTRIGPRWIQWVNVNATTK